MRTCPSCGAGNRESAGFCDSCGTKLGPLAPREEQRKTVSILFCDASGSTSLGERLDPESVRRLMERYFEQATRVIEAHGGTVEKFIGDAVMAVFGVPTVHEDDALRAVRSAHDLQGAVKQLADELERDFGTTLTVRIGVNTGEVVSVLDQLLATGDAVNVASRLEQEAPPGEILIGSETLNLVRGAVVVGARELLTLKGKAEPVAAYRLIGLTGDGPVARNKDVPMVGRSRELQVLSIAFQAAIESRSCQLFTLLGGAGVGKSRLVHEFLRSVGEATVVAGNCLSYGEGITYWPVIGVLRQLEPTMERTLGDARAMTVLGGLLRGDDVISSSEEIAWAFRTLLEACGRQAPLVCMLDDVHWGEARFLDLVENMADLSRDSPILLLCMARPELLDRRPTWSGGKLNATTTLLEPLGSRETLNLVKSLALDAQLDDGAITRISESAEGNPFFCEQLVAFSRESDGRATTVPSTIQMLVAARLDQLDPSERRVLGRGSVEGRVFHQSAVEFLGQEQGDTGPLLTSLVRRDLIRPHPAQLCGDQAYRFRHLLIRDAAYDGMAKSTRAGMHESFSRWLSEHRTALPELDEIRGYHLEQAHRYRKELGPEDDTAKALRMTAAALLHRAGRRARERGDMAGSTNLLARSLDLTPVEDRSADLDLDYVQTLCLDGKAEAAIEIADVAERRAMSAGDEIGGLKLRLERTRQLSYLGPDKNEPLRAAVEDSLPIFERAEDDEGLVAALLGLTELHMRDMRFADASDSADRAHAHAKRAEDAGKAGEALYLSLSARIAGPQRVDEVLAWCRAQTPPATAEPIFAVVMSELMAMAGNLEDARHLAGGAVARLTLLGLQLDLAVAASSQWQIEMYAGNAIEAEGFAQKAYEAFSQRGERGEAAWAALCVAESLLALGRVDDAADWAKRGSERDGSAQCISLLARIEARRGDAATAMKMAEDAYQMVADTAALNLRAEVLMAQADVLDHAGVHDQAIRSREAGLELYGLKGNLSGALRAKAELSEVVLSATSVPQGNQLD